MFDGRLTDITLSGRLLQMVGPINSQNRKIVGDSVR